MDTQARSGRPPLDNPRTEDIRIRCTADEKATLAAAAAASGEPLARWVRVAALAAAARQQ